MTTSIHVYRDLAVKYGKVDPTEPDAVDHLFENDVYSLSRITQLRIISTLNRHISGETEEYTYKEIRGELPFPNPANYKRVDTGKN